MIDVLVIADDLTGALDSAVAFAARGVKVIVARGDDDLDVALACEPDILAINSASRELLGDEATVRLRELIQRIDIASFGTVMKKIDSRLKGHVGIETAIVSEFLGRSRPLAVMPAIPSMDRFQDGGKAFGSGFDEPIDIRSLFDADVLVPDIKTDIDLDRAVAAHPGALWVGARGLAFALARRRCPQAPTVNPSLPAPFAVVVGSRDPITTMQVGAASGADLHEAPGGHVPEAAGLGAETYLICLTEGDVPVSANEIGARFADGVAVALERARPRSLLLTGGETAAAVLDKIVTGPLMILGEIAPGLPVCDAATAWGSVRIITKSGGFGEPDLFSKLFAQAIPSASDGDDRIGREPNKGEFVG